MTRVTAPATAYQLSVPPGDYAVIARLNADPFSAAGYFACTLDGCQSHLSTVRVEAAQTVAHIDISGWGSQQATDLLWRIDSFGAPMSTTVSTPTPVAAASASPLPVRQRPHGPTPPLPEANDLASYYNHGSAIRLDRPAGWRQIHPEDHSYLYTPFFFVNEEVTSPLGLDSHGVYLIVQEQYYCFSSNFAGVDAEASFFNTPQGMAHFYFRDRDGSPGRQPYKGPEYLGTKDAQGYCVYFKFIGATKSARDSNLLTFDQIVFQARLVPA